MIAWDKILSELIGVVGWRQSMVDGDVTIDATNLASSSGLFVQGAHPMVTVRNIKATQEDPSITDAEMNTLLSNIVKDGTSKVIKDVFPPEDVFSNGLLYPGESDFSEPLDRTGFLGYEITIANRKDIVSILNKIILQFNGSGSVKIILFNSGQKTPIASKTIPVTADTNTSASLDWILGYITAPGGKYYLGYISSSLKPYNRTITYPTRFNSIDLKPMYVPDWSSETLFDINDIVYTSECYGINLDITTAKDYSNIILQNKDRFAQAIQLSSAAEAISLMTSTSRINPEERVVINALDKKIIIDSPATYNLYNSLEKEIKSLKSLFAQRSFIGTL